MGAATPILRGSRVLLTAPRPQDKFDLVAFHLRNAAFFKPWLPRPSGNLSNPDFWTEWIAHSQAMFAQDQAVHLILRLQGVQPDLIVGQVDYSLVLRGPLSSAMVGFQIDRQFAGRGFMREALELSLDYMFRRRRVHRIVAAYVPENEPSARLLRALGFVKEGEARDFLEIDGVRRTHIVTARLSTDHVRGEETDAATVNGDA